jgi:hypothetical protein
MRQTVFLVPKVGKVYHIRGAWGVSVCRCVHQGDGPNPWSATLDRPKDGRLCGTCAEGLGYHGA